jgi:hypothetical protein
MTVTLGVLSAMTTGYWGKLSDRIGRSTRVTVMAVSVSSGALATDGRDRLTHNELGRGGLEPFPDDHDHESDGDDNDDESEPHDGDDQGDRDGRRKKHDHRFKAIDPAMCKSRKGRLGHRSRREGGSRRVSRSCRGRDGGVRVGVRMGW